MAWIYLLTAGMLEITCTTVYRLTEGLTRAVPTVSFFALGFLSFYFLNKSLASIPIGTSYAVWTGIGAAGHTRLLEDFVAAIRDARDPLAPGREGRRSLALVLAIYEAARTGRAVRIE